mmetsp:Transcript_81780/g.159630  ORF Transcript_81780/g.159630 Transcript_81780/m.159630 type:complete len:231 (-) Transcript_81780:125-817(-)
MRTTVTIFAFIYLTLLCSSVALFLLPRKISTAVTNPLKGVVGEGLDAESDTVGPGIYGGGVLLDDAGNTVIGQQYEEHNAFPGPVYDGSGYTAINNAVRTSPKVAESLLASTPKLVDQLSTGTATPLHVCAMNERAQHSAVLLISYGAKLEARDGWGYTALQRAATNNLGITAKALIDAGASHSSRSGLDEDGESARGLAKRLRSFDVLRVFQQWELSQGLPLPDGEFEL